MTFGGDVIRSDDAEADGSSAGVAEGVRAAARCRLPGGERPRRTMKAIVQDRYGPPDVLRFAEIEPPSVGPDEVLVRVRAASVHPDVWHVLHGVPYVLRLMGAGLRRPSQPVPGIDVAGVVEAAGAAVTRFGPGDEVFGETVKGFQWRNGGAFAEYVAAPASALARKPGNLGFEQAAAVPTSGLIAWSALHRQARVKAGEHVLVNGAGGGVGTFVVQLAKAAGTCVTAVDAAGKLAALTALGADRVIDYATVDFTRGSERYDVIVDIPGNHSFADCRRVLAHDGTYVLIGHDGYGTTAGRRLGSLPRVLPLVAQAPFRRQLPPVDFSTPDKAAVLDELARRLEAGELQPVIERTYPLSEAAEAIRHLETGRVTGKIVLVSLVDAASRPG
jgi:NADPH:quinone reductase-like Zn-dependent oxidoreductase